jgi:hypothetical protein
MNSPISLAFPTFPTSLPFLTYTYRIWFMKPAIRLISVCTL